ncbi:hypothetical protein [Paenibacillus alvei]|uniref:Uncharacterized protein n=1 Tax=Paenibacillus alvei TaxID=44250 RepID=A0AAP7A0G4_PAEAL|nr:hypothetical protein [Paenibacillus alvei]NOJ73294.1 hypothetical protein [Paenibacillus alvei]
MLLSIIQQEALEQARKHGGRLIRWSGGCWTFQGAAIIEGDSGSKAIPEWHCTTNTIFALMRRGYILMEDWKSCTLVESLPSLKSINMRDMLEHRHLNS